MRFFPNCWYHARVASRFISFATLGLARHRGTAWVRGSRHPRRSNRTWLTSEPLETRSMLDAASLAGIAPVLAPGSDSGYSQFDNITNVALPQVDITLPGTITLAAGDQIQLLDGSTVIATQPATLGLNTLTPSSPLSDAASAHGANHRFHKRRRYRQRWYLRGD